MIPMDLVLFPQLNKLKEKKPVHYTKNEYRLQVSQTREKTIVFPDEKWEIKMTQTQRMKWSDRQ